MSDENVPRPEQPATPPPVAPEEITSDDKLWGLLSYVLAPIVPIIILFWEEKKNRPFLKAHLWQALVAGIVEIVISAILGVIPFVQCIAPFVGLAIWVVMIYYGLQAFNGKTFTIPVISDFVKNQGWG